MSTRETIDRFFGALRNGGGWEEWLAADLVFTSHTSPVRSIAGRDAALPALKRFYWTIAGVDVQRVLVDGDLACVQTRYRIRASGGGVPFESDVAELFTVRDERIATFDIYFDTAPYPR